MAVSDPFSRDVRASKSPRNAFPVSYSTLFSSPVGQILPCYVEEVDKDDKLKIDVSNITRTRPLVTSAYMTFDEKVDFWFVPYRLLWSDYDNWRIGQSYRYRTTELSNAGRQYLLPYCRFADFSLLFSSFKTPITGSNYYFYPNPADTLRYLDLLGYSTPRGLEAFTSINAQTLYDVSGILGKVSLYYSALSPKIPVNYFRLAAFQCVYMHGYRNEEYEKLDPSYYNCDNLFNNLTVSNSAYETGNPPTYSTNNRLVVGDTGSSGLNTLTDRLTLMKLFTPRYKNWRQDLFTSLKPSSGFENGVSGLEFRGNVNGTNRFTGSDFTWPQPFISQPYAPGNGSQDQFVNPTQALAKDEGSTTTSVQSTSIDFNTLSTNPALVYQRLSVINVNNQTGQGEALLYPQIIRNLMSQDKFVRSSIYAKKDLSSQMKALFGDSYDDDRHAPKYLGSYSSNVQISDVTATSAGSDGLTSVSSNGNNIMGETVGKIHNQSGKSGVVNNTFKEDGIVLGLHYVMPRNNYDSFRIARNNTKVSRWDYFYPQFDGLGMQPVFMFERGLPSAEKVTTGAEVTGVLGFAPRFFEYKQRTNEVHDIFMSGESEDFWTLSNNAPVVTSASDPANFKCLPTITDRIFGRYFDGSAASCPFFHYYYFDVTRVTNKEVYGTPSI